eukprot:CAMPEP_0174694592 /NCGR_PEP_ID=MMETSP1094-20130205/1152_1 /TAXON_ID=156173 /ORGANISM="Chrysochromulina brevifilum, Strain UTEX LB 985" /LENGTH=94 /DNA_ID=CAMNT_0015890871 /DNA_START=582 /DNA_END=867 /DNA_ORIENTATION=-
MVLSAGEGRNLHLKGTRRGHYHQVDRARYIGVSGRLWDQCVRAKMADPRFPSSSFFRGARSMMASDAGAAVVGAGRALRTVLATALEQWYNLER